MQKKIRRKCNREENAKEEPREDEDESSDSDGKWSDVTSEDEYNEIFENIRLKKI